MAIAADFDRVYTIGSGIKIKNKIASIKKNLLIILNNKSF
jgi:hypothetical protein